MTGINKSTGVKRETTPKKELVAKVAPFDIKAIKLKPQLNAPHVHKSTGTIIVYDSKLGLKEAEVWHNKNVDQPSVADMHGNALRNVTHILTFE